MLDNFVRGGAILILQIKKEMFMKKISILLLIVLALFSFSACDNSGSSPDDMETSASAEQIEAVNGILTTLISELMTNQDIVSKDGIISLNDENYDYHGVGGGTLNANGKIDTLTMAGYVDVNANLSFPANPIYGLEKDMNITYDGRISFEGETIDFSGLIATIDGKTVNGKDIELIPIPTI